MFSMGVTPRSRWDRMRCTQKELREKLGVSRDTLRLYEQKGIIEPEIDPNNGYRYYDDWQVNLLWDCKHYQSMGFSLTEILEILKSDTMERLRTRVEHRAQDIEAEVARKQLELAALRARAGEMSQAEHGLGTYREVEFTGRIYVPVRENHGFRDHVDAHAVQFMNTHLSLMEPLLWFPDAGRNRFFWGYAMTPETYGHLNTEAVDRLTTIEAGLALSTWIDARERWNIKLALFDGLRAEAERRHRTPRGEICADLIARAHGTDGYHRYLHPIFPLQTRTPAVTGRSPLGEGILPAIELRTKTGADLPVAPVYSNVRMSVCGARSYAPQTSFAISSTRAILAHCSSSVSLLPISQLAKPHCGER